MKKTIKLITTLSLAAFLCLIPATSVKAAAGWVNSGDLKTFYYDSSGNPVKGWQLIDGAWYYFGNTSGVMQTGLFTLNERLYYLAEDGVMQTGAVRLPDGATYHFSESGSMSAAPGWQLVNGSYYYFNPDGTVVTNWKLIDGFYVNNNGQRIENVITRGIDVSRWQGKIDWNKVASDDVSFAMIRVGSVKFGVDAYFHANMKAAADAGIKTGVYIYSYATTPEEARAEAEFVISHVHNYPVSFPIAIDIEDNVHKSKTPAELSAIAMAFAQVIEDAGYRPILYSSTSWYDSRFEPNAIASLDKWVAQYFSRVNYSDPSIWQSSSTGSVNGISGNVDINFLYKDYSNIIIPHGWSYEKGHWYYFSNYRKQTGWLNDNSTWYYLNNKRQMVTGWFLQGNTWYYLKNSGAMATGWNTVGNDTYHFTSNGAMNSGWEKIGDQWFYFLSSGPLVRGWFQEGNITYYLKENGAMSVGWTQIGNNWHYFHEAGNMATDWFLDNNTWYYLNSDGSMKTGWATIGGQRHYFKESGAMAVGFTGLPEGRYYFDQDGYMMTGWLELDSKWYYLKENGIMQTGWFEENGKRYYFDGNGIMQTGWVLDNGSWYYFNENGNMMTGWIQTKSSSESEAAPYYYLAVDGKMQTGFITIASGNYYLYADGSMATGWVSLPEGWYYFTESGSMVTNTEMIIDGVNYQFAPSGLWIEVVAPAETVTPVK